MFVPPLYREPDAGWLVDLMRRHPLALFVTNGDASEGPSGTHLPVIADGVAPPNGESDLRGATLLGHMNRANPQWRALRPGMPAMLSFTGPHAYVSPVLYPPVPAAPTWDFTAVQVRGTVETISCPEEALAVVRRTAQTLEADFGEGWDSSGADGHFRRILPGVGAFRFTITRAQAMFKLSQEQDDETRARVCHHFALAESGTQRATADYMTRLAEADRP